MLELDRLRLTSHVVAAMRRMDAEQRVDFVGRVLRADPQLEPVLPEVLAACARARRAQKVAPIIRDSVS